MSLASLSAPVVETASGRLSGFDNRGVATFLGVPYAAPPVGSLRFMPPQPAKAWSGVREALAYGATAPQARRGDPNRPPPIWLDAPGLAMDEDCLFLNVWTGGLGQARKRPVMVWVHTGGFGSGSGSAPLFEGDNLARGHDVVVVSFNHRLSVLGCTLLEHLDPDFTGSANAGMLDIVAVLAWVRDNIEAFGGDPSRVMLMGESGGGLKISTLMGMPSAKGLFHRVAIQSGARPRHLDIDLARRATDFVLAEAGAKTPRDLQAAPVEALLAGLSAAMKGLPKQGPGLPHPFTPIVDGVITPCDPFDTEAAPYSAEVAMLVGYNKTEATYFTRMGYGPNDPDLTYEAAVERLRPVMFEATETVLAAFREAYPRMSPWDLYITAFTEYPTGAFSRHLAELKSRQGAAPAYMYRFDWDRAQWGKITGAPHMIELPFVFDNVERGVSMVGDAPEAIAFGHRVAAAWAAFAHTGNPSTDAMPDWPAYDAATRQLMRIDLESHVAHDLPDGPRLAADAGLGLKIS